MELFFKEGARKTPKISFDPVSGDFELSGRSFLDDPYEFYNDLFEWLDKYLEVPLSLTMLVFDTDYYNSESYKCFLKIIKKLESIKDKNHEVLVTWIYDRGDEEIMEAGEDLKEFTSLSINVKEK